VSLRGWEAAAKRGLFACWYRLSGGLQRAGSAFAGHVRLGAWGEQLAARRLRRRGYRIIARNYRAGGAEVDLIALDGDTLVFIEVKTRRRRACGEAAEAVNPHKCAQIKRAAAFFVQRQRAGERNVRFDVVTLSGLGRRARLEIIKDAF
jgi:putative endonuclease